VVLELFKCYHFRMTLTIWNFETGEKRGQMMTDLSRSEHLMHDCGSDGWRAHEVLTERERMDLSLKAQDEIVFTEARS
jgi:hypothetical protein